MGLTVAELEQEIVSQGAEQAGLLAEVTDARGTAGTLGARLDVALNPDGTPRTSVTAAAFVTEVAPIIAYPLAGEYVALKGDLTAVYVAKCRLRINGALLPYVTSSTYDAGGDYTVVNFSTPVGYPITSVEYSFDPAAMPPIHYADNPDIEQVVSGDSTFATKHLSDAQYKSLLDDTLARVTIASLASVDDGAGVDLVGRAFKYVDTIDDLRTLTPTDAPVYVQGRTIPGDGGQGTFVWSTADLSAKVAADPLHGIYVAPTSDPTGASGAWVRQYEKMYLEYFVTPSSSVDSSPAVESIKNIFPSTPVVLYLSTFHWLLSECYVKDELSIIGTGVGTSGFVSNIDASTIALKIGDETSDVRTNQQRFEDFSIVGGTNTCLYGLYVFKPIKSTFKNVIVWTGSASYGIVIEGAIGSRFEFFGVDNIAWQLPALVGTTTSPIGGAVLIQSNSTEPVFPININSFDHIYARESGAVGFTVSSSLAGSKVSSLYAESNDGSGLSISNTRGFIIDSFWSEDNGDVDVFDGNRNIKLHSFSASTALDFSNDVAGFVTGEANELRIQATCTGFAVGQFRHSFNHGLDRLGGGIQDLGANTQYIGTVWRADGGASKFYGPQSGTWTPVLSFGWASTGITYSTQYGYYQRIGNVVFVQGSIHLTSKGSSTGDAAITLPFTALNTDGNENTVSIYASAVTSLSGYLSALVNKNTSHFYPAEIRDSGVIDYKNDTDFSDTSFITFNCWYTIQ